MPKVHLFYPAVYDDPTRDITFHSPNPTKHMINALFERCSQTLPAKKKYCSHITAYIRAFCEGTFILLAGVCNNQNKQGIGGQTPPGF